MFAILGPAAAIAALSLPALPGQATPASNPLDIVEIDGSKNPALIPEYLVWEHGFGGLAIIKDRDMKPAMATLALSPRDAELVFKEAGAQATRDRRRGEHEKARREALAGAKPAELAAALHDVILEYRWEVLDARDRLLASLSPEGQVELIRWMNERRTHITAFVPRSELDFFRQPR